MKTIPTKSILAPFKNPESWFGKRYNMNLYRGCTHGCIYCDSRSDCYRIPDFDELAVKEGALAILEKELRSKREKGIVGMGAMSDPYNPLEKQLMLTGKSLELLDKHGFGVHIPTKSDLVTRDIPILQSIARHSPVSIGITITASEDGLAGMIEPAAPSSSRRFAALQELARHGIYAGILMMPILPFISDQPENILTLVRTAAECGARYIFPWFGLTLRPGQREFFYRALDRHYPGLKERYQATYGNAYECLSPDHRRLWRMFTRECQSRDIRYRMPDIIEGAKRMPVSNQLPLF
ncbi:DNA repair photolyase [Hydrogenispora ethanolica]|uniref:DNA repair photolyase n=1 Tax=Hydrogenispora ethanolica TaxID=1082276 RepID=A0A4R1RRK2_HYDET|nr:radical SAM protein [Hydrogenispora ethanolica]TCL68582.1 DNA repair photolyase [Hydrogenispora ethanolica]